MTYYSNSPIVEAVIDLRVERNEGTTFEQVENYCNLFQDEYPKRSQQLQFTFKFGVDKDAAKSPTGLVLKNQRSGEAVQARLNGFSFSKVAPYLGWAQCRDKAKDLWKSYKEVLKPSLVKRVALRYINKFEIPSDVEIADYLNIFPEVRKPMPQTLQGFLTRVQIGLEDSDAEATISESTVPSKNSDTIAILLDIDVFKASNIVPGEDGSLWEFLEHLHVKQLDLFESCITDKTRELIT